MSMLAEKKRSVKWQLNPRGTNLLEKPNFGKKLLEKMGWKNGQGLGANNQGETQFIKVKQKNDNEGLGFKKTGDEWLKTTSEFNELLDRLSNDTAEESTEQNSSSLEDRSKKSKARVHYHKFTRGKDLSRYSNKDLASIIGPDLFKGKHGSEQDSDYSTNQVNSGSSEDYFNGKKRNEPTAKTNINIGNSVPDTYQEIVHDNNVCITKNKQKNVQSDLNLEGDERPKKKKKHSDVDEELKTEKKRKKSVTIKDEQNLDVSQLSEQLEPELGESRNENTRKKKKKRKNKDAEINNGFL